LAPIDSTPIAPVDDVMTAFMQQCSVPGLSLAITKDERLALAATPGWPAVDLFSEP
jgi:hypothetical protein